jgi:hypothetical protein
LFFRSQDDFELTFRSNDEFEIRSMEGQVTRYRRPAPYTPTADDLRAFAGRYESEEIGSIYRIVPGKKGLEMRFEISPTNALELNPVKRDIFEFAGRMTVRFHRDKSGKVIAFDFNHPSASNIRFTRLGDLGAHREPIAATTTSIEAITGAAPVRLEALIGYYELVPGRGITITVENGKLHGEATGNPKKELVHKSGTTYRIADGSSLVTITFTIGTAGKATALVMRQGNAERNLPKVQ